MVPLRLAFYEEDSTEWKIINSSIDFFFLIDMIFTFFQTYFDDKNHIHISDKKKIALKYLKTWFFLDLISIFPFDYILNAANIN
jgi:potassium channel